MAQESLLGTSDPFLDTKWKMDAQEKDWDQMEEEEETVFKKWEITEKAIKFEFEEKCLFDEMKNLSLNKSKKSLRKGSPKKAAQTSKNFKFVQIRATDYLLGLYPDCRDMLAGFGAVDAKIQQETPPEDEYLLNLDPENPTEEQNEFMEFPEAPSHNSKNVKIIKHAVEPNTAKTKVDFLGNLERMNLPPSLKERFGTSLAKMQREMPDANLDNRYNQILKKLAHKTLMINNWTLLVTPETNTVRRSGPTKITRTTKRRRTNGPSGLKF
jgi:hypothetical protein